MSATNSQRAKDRVFKAAMRSFRHNMKHYYDGSIEKMLAASFTTPGRALIRACAALTKGKRK